MSAAAHASAKGSRSARCALALLLGAAVASGFAAYLRPDMLIALLSGLSFCG